MEFLFTVVVEPPSQAEPHAVPRLTLGLERER